VVKKIKDWFHRDYIYLVYYKTQKIYGTVDISLNKKLSAPSDIALIQDWIQQNCNIGNVKPLIPNIMFIGRGKRGKPGEW
jgi:hypothetical protein